MRSRPRGEDDAVAAWRALLVASDHVLRAIEADLRQAGAIPLTWYDVLLELRSAPEPLRMGELADRIVLSRSRVSRLVTEIEQAGLAHREPDPDDGRVQRVALAARGRAALHRAAPVYLQGISEHFARHLDEDELRIIASALGRVHRHPGAGR